MLIVVVLVLAFVLDVELVLVLLFVPDVELVLVLIRVTHFGHDGGFASIAGGRLKNAVSASKLREGYWIVRALRGPWRRSILRAGDRHGRGA